MTRCDRCGHQQARRLGGIMILPTNVSLPPDFEILGGLAVVAKSDKQREGT